MISASEITVLAVPRSGTNFFCECLGEFRNVLSLYEIFNPAGVFGLNQSQMSAKVADLAGIDATDARDKGLVFQFRQRPNESLSFLRQAAGQAGYQIVSYKIFPRQLPSDAMQRLLSNPDRTFVFVQRRRLDTYISYVKARHSGEWKQANTTTRKVELDVDAFLEWSKSVDSWYTECKQALDDAGQGYLVFDYEQSICQPKQRVVQEIEAAFQGTRLDMKKKLFTRAVKFKKQDLSVDPFEKINNGLDAKCELSGNHVLEYALDYPLSISTSSAD